MLDPEKSTQKEKYHGWKTQMLGPEMGDYVLARVTEAFLKMKKFDIAALKRAYKGV
jgi:predicted 3-demethylubiquinone-9 3-methyltransferase (glyoxalase superfamily)